MISASSGGTFLSRNLSEKWCPLYRIALYQSTVSQEKEARQGDRPGLSGRTGE
jgi:hypothetical protein